MITWHAARRTLSWGSDIEELTVMVTPHTAEHSRCPRSYKPMLGPSSKRRCSGLAEQRRFTF